MCSCTGPRPRASRPHRRARRRRCAPLRGVTNAWGQQTDVLVYGATPAGIAAALAAASDGEKVMLVERSDRIGGMLTNGLSQPEFRSHQSLGGFYKRFTAAVLEAYRP